MKAHSQHTTKANHNTSKEGSWLHLWTCQFAVGNRAAIVQRWCPYDSEITLKHVVLQTWGVMVRSCGEVLTKTFHGFQEPLK